MRHIIYKIVNKLNNRYYIGRHSTSNIDDVYMGNGKAILNAIKKYGEENFTKEIIAEAKTSGELWELEKAIVNEAIVKDPLSYNMTFGGKSYLDGLKKYDYDNFILHQSRAGKQGGPVSYRSKTEEDRLMWHKAGGKAASKVNRESLHPFYTGEAASKGGKAVKGMVELWNPNSKATNKNQEVYKRGDSKKARPGTEKYNALVYQGWLTIDRHVEKQQ